MSEWSSTWMAEGGYEAGGCRCLRVCVDMKACGFGRRGKKSGGWAAFPEHSFRSDAGWNGNIKIK